MDTGTHTFLYILYTGYIYYIQECVVLLRPSGFKRYVISVYKNIMKIVMYVWMYV